MLKFNQIQPIRRKKQMTNHDQLVGLFETYVQENAKFVEKGVKASASRARKALADIAKLCKSRRVEIQEKKNQMEGK